MIDDTKVWYIGKYVMTFGKTLFPVKNKIVIRNKTLPLAIYLYGYGLQIRLGFMFWK